IVKNYSRNILSWHFESRSGIKATCRDARVARHDRHDSYQKTARLARLVRCPPMSERQESPGRAGAFQTRSKGGVMPISPSLDLQFLPKGKKGEGRGSRRPPAPPRPRDRSGLATAQRV